MADDKAQIGTGDQTTVIPTTYLSDQEARLLRRYKAWLTEQDLLEMIICPVCWESRTAEPPDVRIRLSPDQVVVLCPHELLFAVSAGPSQFPEPNDPLIENSAIEEVAVPDGDHLMLLAYRAFLSKHRRKEALFCRQCERWGRPPGVRASVTEASVRFQCRHRFLSGPVSLTAPVSIS